MNESQFIPYAAMLVGDWRRRVHALGRDTGSYRQCADELESALAVPVPKGERPAMNDIESAAYAANLRRAEPVAAKALNDLIDAAVRASSTLSHAYNTVLTGELAENAHFDFMRLDAAIKAVRL